MKYPWLRIPWLVPSCFTSWVWPFGIVVSKMHKHEVSSRHRAHEEQHVVQHRTWLVLALPVWFILAVASRFIYFNHPWERQARDAGAYNKTVSMRWWESVAGIVSTALFLLWLTKIFGLQVY